MLAILLRCRRPKRPTYTGKCWQWLALNLYSESLYKLIICLPLQSQLLLWWIWLCLLSPSRSLLYWPRMWILYPCLPMNANVQAQTPVGTNIGTGVGCDWAFREIQGSKSKSKSNSCRCWWEEIKIRKSRMYLGSTIAEITVFLLQISITTAAKFSAAAVIFSQLTWPLYVPKSSECVFNECVYDLFAHIGGITTICSHSY